MSSSVDLLSSRLVPSKFFCENGERVNAMVLKCLNPSKENKETKEEKEEEENGYLLFHTVMKITQKSSWDKIKSRWHAKVFVTYLPRDHRYSLEDDYSSIKKKMGDIKDDKSSKMCLEIKVNINASNDLYYDPVELSNIVSLSRGTFSTQHDDEWSYILSSLGNDSDPGNQLNIRDLIEFYLTNGDQIQLPFGGQELLQQWFAEKLGSKNSISSSPPLNLGKNLWWNLFNCVE
jgi:hypothetical protein